MHSNIEGYKVDTDRLSIMGLSNGGSAIDCAYSSNPRMFKNLVYVSTGVNNYHRIPGKVMIIGGGVDHCAPSMERSMRRLKANGQKSAFLYDQEDTHLKLVSDRRNCLRFLREEL